MARKQKEDAVVEDDLDGTVEGLAREHFEREKKAYEDRTGETVEFVPSLPLTRTPVKDVSKETENIDTNAVDVDNVNTTGDEKSPEGEGDN